MILQNLIEIFCIFLYKREIYNFLNGFTQIRITVSYFQDSEQIFNLKFKDKLINLTSQL